MHHRAVALPYRPAPFALLIAIALLALAALVRPVSAQDATPLASPTGGTADCTEPLGLPAGGACVNVIHASPDAPAVDVYVDGAVAVPGLAFGSASGYVGLPAGQHQVDIAAAGSPVDQAVVTATVDLTAGVAYEVAATGLLGEITATVTTANLDPLGADLARIRVIQAIPSAPAADVALAGGDVLLPNVTYGVPTAYAEVPAGATPVDLEIRAAGQPTALLTIPGAALEPGLVYSFYPIGDLADPTTLSVLPIVAPASGSSLAGTPVAGEAIPLAPATPTS